MTAQPAQELLRTRVRSQVVGPLIEEVEDASRHHVRYEKQDPLSDLVGVLRANEEFSCLTLQGKRVSTASLPERGAELSPDNREVVRESFKDRVIRFGSAGRIASCFEAYLHYVIDNSQALSKQQELLIRSLCAIVSKHKPLPALRMASYALNNLDQPQLIRDVVVANFRNKDNHLARMGEVFRTTWCRHLPNNNRVISILALGYSHSVAEMIHSFADRASAKLRVYLVADDQSNQQERLNSLRAQITRSRDKEEAIEYVRPVDIRSPEFTERKYDFVLVGSKVVGVRDSSSVEVITSSYAADAIDRLAERDPHPPVVVSAGLYKIWGQNFYEAHREFALNMRRKDGSLINRPIEQHTIRTIVTEFGFFTPDEAPSIDIVQFALQNHDLYNLSMVRRIFVNARSSLGINETLNISEYYERISEQDLLLIEELIMADGKDNSQDRTYNDSDSLKQEKPTKSLTTELLHSASAKFDALLSDPSWCSQHTGKIVAISGRNVHEYHVVTFEEARALLEGRDGCWVIRRVHKDPSQRGVFSIR